VVKSQIKNWYKGLAKEIAHEIKVTLAPQQESLLAETDPVDPGAYDLNIMRG
jgi:hypothetical protein